MRHYFKSLAKLVVLSLVIFSWVAYANNAAQSHKRHASAANHAGSASHAGASHHSSHDSHGDKSKGDKSAANKTPGAPCPDCCTNC